MKTLNFGKYKNIPLQDIPFDYTNWMSQMARTQALRNHAKAIYKSYRFLKHNMTNLQDQRHVAVDESRRQYEGQYENVHVFQVHSKHLHLSLYYLVDQDGNYIRDLSNIGHQSVKQGAIDKEKSDWITLSPSGTKYQGKMVVSPYYEHFEWETYKTPITD